MRQVASVVTIPIPISRRVAQPHHTQLEEDAERFLGIPTNLPLIPDYAKTCSRRPNLLDGYKQWLEVVAQWGYDITEVYDGYQVWSMAYYQWLWEEHDGRYFPEQVPNAIKVQ